jgi:hypothetical protein
MMRPRDGRLRTRDIVLAIIADRDRQTDDDRFSDKLYFGWGFGLSLLLHGLLALYLFTDVVELLPEPEETPIEVTLVPFSEPEQAEPETEAPEPETPEPETPEQPPEEQQEEGQETPPPAPPPPPPPPPPPAPQEPAEAEQPTEAAILPSVEEFAEEDSGPQETVEETPPGTDEPDQETTEDTTPEEQEPDQDTAESAPDETAPSEDVVTEEAETGEPAVPEETEEEAEDEAASTEVADETTVPEPDAAPDEEITEETAGTGADADTGPDGETPAEDFGIVGPIATNATPAPKPARRAGAGRRQAAPETGTSGPPAGMQAARELFSNEDPRVLSAMRGLSANERLKLLCVSELERQLSAVSAVPPESFPVPRRVSGTVVDLRGVAFKSLGRWFDLSFRCETNSDVTRVENFAFKIGNEVSGR